ncbi:MAG TPA: GNAT family N-acetyltransferase [Cellvibrio sp.]|nr:GNAT family N-acetyltransferase [Cellvibrio sp.]
MDIELTTNPSPEDAAVLLKGLVDYNNTQNPELLNEHSTKLFLFVRNNKNNIIGGLRASGHWNTLHIEIVWLDEAHRHQKIGTELMKKAEAFATERGYSNIFLDTTSWQAKGFYEKLGYELMATIPDRPKGCATYYFNKRLL